jgi:hypothetical protein
MKADERRELHKNKMMIWREKKRKEANFSPSLLISYEEKFSENSLVRDASMSLSFT